MPASKKHIHKYMRQQLKHVKVWRCTLPDCSHWMPPNLEDLLIGRSSICWGCGSKFTLDEESMKEESPQCFACRTPTVETPYGDLTVYSEYLIKENKG